MLNTSDIKQRFNHIEQSIMQAEKACQAGAGVPKDLKDSIHKLSTETDRAKPVFQSQDEKQIRKCVDQLEMYGDQARDACQRAGKLDDALKSSVMQVHSELSELKHQLH
ncbi:hypothetical protein ACFQAT_20955 [Undibacterium arcticum]|uniref:DUF2383 domain-containing protein n=1 Tax=Undibacterium arcticum TaxID=1762892 RepID=A0ABV7EWL6_9BURK